MTSLGKWAIALTALGMSAPSLAGTIPVPEPGTFGLMAVGVVALVATAIRRRN